MTLLNMLMKVSVLTFVVSSMLAMGAGLTLGQVLEPLRNVRLVLSALIANFLLMPLAAMLLSRALGLEESLAIGLLLVGCTAGAPFLPKLAEMARAGVAFSVGLMALLMVATIAYLPIVLPKLVPHATVEPWKIARSLLVLMLLPLVAGLIVKAQNAPLAGRMKALLDKVSSVSLVMLVVLILALNVDKMIAIFGSRGILASLLFVVLGLGIGWLLGGPARDTRQVMAFGTAQRNIGAALVVGGTLNDPKVVIMVIVIAIVGFLVLLPLSRAVGARALNVGTKAA